MSLNPISSQSLPVLFITSWLCVMCCFSLVRPWNLCASFSYELVCHVAACVWVSMFAIWNLVFVQLFVYLFLFIHFTTPSARNR